MELVLDVLPGLEDSGFQPYLVLILSFQDVAIVMSQPLQRSPKVHNSVLPLPHV